MPCHAWHESKKLHNYGVAQYLARAPSQFTDWEITALFYSALNFVDSFLAKAHNIDLVYNHNDRKNLIRSYLSLIERNYRMLYHLSRDARYNDVPIRTRELNRAKSYYGDIKLRLTPILCQCGHKNLVNKGNCDICRRVL